MKKSNFLLLWVFAAIVIVTISMNGWQIKRGSPVPVPEAMLPEALFVCPAADKSFDQMAAQLSFMSRGAGIVFSVLVMLWLALLGWAFYMSLIKDKFDEPQWELPIFMPKFLALAAAIWMVAVRAPNYWRAVSIRGSDEKWVLCERDSTNARAVRAAAVSPADK